MKFRIASALFALALPLAAQSPTAQEAEVMFYKAFYLEKGQRDFVGAMALYEEFLQKAPEHKFAAEAAKANFKLLNSTGKTKERDAFKAKYAKLIGDAANEQPAADSRPGPGRNAPGGDEGRGAGPGGPGGRMDPQARLAELEKQLAKAKADGDTDTQKRLEQQIERTKQMGERGAAGQGRARGGLFGLLAGDKKFADMTDEEKTNLQKGVEQSTTMIDRMRENGQDDLADKLETNVAALKKALEAKDDAAAQKAIDALKESFGGMRRPGGQGGGAGGRRGGGGGAGGGEGGGRGGNSGGGGD